MVTSTPRADEAAPEARVSLARRLRRRGVLGINQRNLDYVLAHNPRRCYPLVDDKLQTKQLAIAAGIAVPELYGVVAAQHSAHQLPALLAGRDGFVIKPAHGSGGNGVLVVTGRDGDRFYKASGTAIGFSELEFHVSSTISGLYSLGGVRDRAMIEHCVRFDLVFEAISYQGVPDIRLVVFRGFPVMAMVRLPTRLSDGKANLHQGAVGVGIDLATGHTLTGAWGNEVITDHPDTGRPLCGVAVPAWEAILEIAGRSCELVGLGYVGVDVVLDRDLGPLMLELNARPGLNIQIANRRGLRSRLARVEAEADFAATLAERLAFVRERLSHRATVPA